MTTVSARFLFIKKSIPMEVVQVSSDEVKTILRSLDQHKSSGPDELHPKILKILASFIAKPMAHLFNLSLASGQVPNDWRTATVCPIFKKGSREIPGNYRPVSFTSIVCKILEPILKQSSMHHLQRIEAISKSQDGFLPKKSWPPNLLAMEEKVTQIMDSGNTGELVFPNFPKPSIALTIVFNQETSSLWH